MLDLDNVFFQANLTLLLQLLCHSSLPRLRCVSSLAHQVLSLLRFLVVENQEKLRGAICRLEPFPDGPGEFKELRSVQHELKYSSGAFTLRQVTHTAIDTKYTVQHLRNTLT